MTLPLASPDPDAVVALAAAGRALLRRGEAKAALGPLEAAVAGCPRDRPGDPALLLDLAVAQHLAGDLAGAMARYRAVLALAPGDAGACNGLGALLLRQGDLPGAEVLLRRALDRMPGMPEALNNLARLASWELRLGEAVRLLDAALAARPDFPAARWTRAMARLQAGDMPGGWDDFEARWSLPEVGPGPAIPRPVWDGAPLAGRRLLLQPEQGLGDTIQFARYAPLLAARGGAVVLGVQPPLRRLMRSLEGPGVTVAACGEVLPPIDCHLPLLSVPRALRQGLGDIPAAVPYLVAEPAAVARWRRRIGAACGGAGDGALAVGLVWAGNPRHINDANRSLPPARLAPLAAVPGVRFFGLQCGPGRAVAPGLPGMVDLAEDLDDFAETAAALVALDLLISVDTAPLHLAGALGRPAWALLPAVPDWRWLLGRADSPWYPSLRLFRQPRPGDWAAVIAEVGVALRRRAGA